MEELEKSKIDVEEQLSNRRRDYQQQVYFVCFKKLTCFLIYCYLFRNEQQRAHSKDLEELTQKLTLSREEYRTVRGHVDQLHVNRRTLESELQRLSDTVDVERQRLQLSEQDLRQRVEQLERQHADIERSTRKGKDNLTSLQQQVAHAKSELNEQRRQSEELNRAAESRKLTLSSESAALHEQVHVAAQTLRQLQGQIDLRTHDLEIQGNEARRLERQSEETSRRVRDNETACERAQRNLQELSATVTQTQKKLEVLHKAEDEQKSAQNVLTMRLEADNQAEDALQRRLRLLRDEEQGLAESINQQKRLLAQLRQSCANAQADAETAVNRVVAEQRVVGDLKNTRDVLEAEMARLAGEHSALKDRIGEETHRLHGSEGAVDRLRSEAGEFQRELVSARRDADEATKQLDGVRVELNRVSLAFKDEKRALEDARLEHRRLEGEVAAAKELLLNLQADRSAWIAALESLKAQCSVLEGTKKAQEMEIVQLRDANRRENARANSLQTNAGELSERVRDQQQALHRIENEVEQARKLSEQEEERLAEQQRLLRQSHTQLQVMETQIHDATSALNAERNKAIREMSALDSAKQQVQGQLIAATNARKRLSTQVETVDMYSVPELVGSASAGAPQAMPSPSFTAAAPSFVSSSDWRAPSPPQRSPRIHFGHENVSVTKLQTPSAAQDTAQNDFLELEREVEKLRKKSMSILGQNLVS
jgi:chromosome segregation ATPase